MMANEKEQNDKRWSMNITQKTKNRAKRTTLKTDVNGCELGWSDQIIQLCYGENKLH